MGEIADDLMDRALFEEDYRLEDDNIEYGLTFTGSKIYWLTRDERLIDIREMEDNHLMNAIRVIERSSYFTRYEYQTMLDEYERRLRERLPIRDFVVVKRPEFRGANLWTSINQPPSKPKRSLPLLSWMWLQLK